MQKLFTLICMFIIFGCADTPGVKNEVTKSPINLSHALSLIDSMLVEDEMIAYICVRRRMKLD